MMKKSDTDPRLEALALRLREARKAAGLSSFHAAGDASGISAHTIKSYEYAKFSPSATNIATLSKTYGVSADWLLGLAEHPSGMPVGQALIDEDTAAAVLAAEDESELVDLLQWDPSMVLCIIEVPPSARVASLQDALDLGQRVVSHIEKVAPHLARRWRSEIRTRKPEGGT